MLDVIRINPGRPNKNVIKNAAKIIRGGGLVIFPTETFYGIAADAFNPEAIRKIFLAKGRLENKPLIILIGKITDLKLVAKKIPVVAKKIIKTFWPGPLTLIFPKKPSVPKEIAGGGSTVAVRQSPHPVALALIKAAGTPITATSANLSGRPSHRTAAGAIKEFMNNKYIDLIIDGGKTPLSKPSTIVDVTRNPPVIVREGAITKNLVTNKW